MENIFCFIFAQLIFADTGKYFIAAGIFLQCSLQHCK